MCISDFEDNIRSAAAMVENVENGLATCETVWIHRETMSTPPENLKPLGTGPLFYGRAGCYPSKAPGPTSPNCAVRRVRPVDDRKWVYCPPRATMIVCPHGHPSSFIFFPLDQNVLKNPCIFSHAR